MNTPTRRIRNARLRYPRSHAAARACILTARLRSKDIALRSVARAGDDAMLAADALRMERDAAHEECATLTAERDHARAIAVALEQEVAVRYSGNRVPMDSDRTAEVEG